MNKENKVNINRELWEILTEFSFNIDKGKHSEDRPTAMEVEDTVSKVLYNMEMQLQREESLCDILRSMQASQQAVYPSSTVTSLCNIDNMENGDKVEDFNLDIEMARRMLDHQFLSRQKMIHSQLEKALYDLVPLICKQHAKTTTKKLGKKRDDDYIFVPVITNNEFVALTGFNEVVNQLKYNNNECNDGGSKVEPVNVCVQCASEVSPQWYTNNNNDDGDGGSVTLCRLCVKTALINELRIDFDSKVDAVRQLYSSQEDILVKDYRDMLASPIKMELFRIEQQKRQRLIVNNNDNKHEEHYTDNGGETGETTALSGVNILQAVQSAHSSNNDSIDNIAEKLQKVLVLLQGNPLLANNNIAVFQLLANVYGLQQPTYNNNNNNNNNLLVNIVNNITNTQSNLNK